MLSTSMAQVNAMVGVQQPSGYKVGFMEGCDSGRLSAGNNSFLFKKDTNRFDTDDVYKQGWNDGFNRCVSGEGAPAASNYSYYQSSYGYYTPGTFYSGFYYPSYYYAPGFSIWTGYYGYPRYRHVHRHNYYYTPWYGGHKHKGHRHRRPWLAKSHGGKGPYIWNRKGGGGGHKKWGGKGRRGKGKGGGRGRGAFIGKR
jgi:hypothetical protein